MGGPRKKSLCHLELTYGRKQRDGVPWLLPLLSLRLPGHKKTNVFTTHFPPLSSGTPFRGLKPWEPPKSMSLYNPSLYKSITSGDSFQRWGANRGANQSPHQSHRPILAFLSSLDVRFSLVFIHSWVKPRLSALTGPSNNLRRFLV